jgi:hypothetical protein
MLYGTSLCGTSLCGTRQVYVEQDKSMYMWNVSKALEFFYCGVIYMSAQYLAAGVFYHNT